VTATTGRHHARHFEDTQPISPARIARALGLPHWRHRRRLTGDDVFPVALIATVVIVVASLAAAVSGWSG
jgi:hypothetical protein